MPSRQLPSRVQPLPAWPYLSTRLKGLLGDDFLTLTELIEVQWPLRLEDNIYITTGGCKRHSCGISDAIVIYELNTFNIIVGLHQFNRSTFYSEMPCSTPAALIKWETKH